jgi:acylglycerol lipase
VPTIDRSSSKTAIIGAYVGTDDKRFHYRSWSALSTDNPVLVYVHGIEGHGLWFDRAAVQLSKQDINVYATDRRGSGLNRSSKNGSSVSYKTLLEDLNFFLKTIRNRHPNSDLYLLGNCWGGTLSILYAQQVKNYTPISGLILSCPAIKTVCDVDWPTKLSIAWSYLCNSKKNFALPLTPEMFTENPKYLEFINNDELRTTTANAHFLVETIKMQYLARQAASLLELPVLLLQSGKDAIVDFKAVNTWYERLKTHDRSYRLFDNACHSLDFEPDISEFLNAMTEWIRR